jgi:hypothetical protein
MPDYWSRRTTARETSWKETKGGLKVDEVKYRKGYLLNEAMVGRVLYLHGNKG